MLIIDKKTEERFLTRLKGLKSNLKNTRAVHYKLSNYDQVNLTKFNQVISEFFEDSYVYIFDDGDAVVISDFVTLKMFKAGNQKLSSALGIEELNFSHIYELEKSYQTLNSIGERKLEVKLEAENIKEKEKIVDPIKKTEKVNFTPDEELLSNLPQRKNNRDNPELLIIEDDDFSRKLVRNALKKDFKVNQAANGSEGINSYLTYAPNIVFLDIEMPDLNGHDVLKKIISFDPDCFVVMLSGNGNKENVLEALKFGAKGFVAKPFTKEKLYEYVNKFKSTGSK